MDQPKEPYRCLIMGAAGRDFHVFLAFLRDNPCYRVVGFTATQIPFIDKRSFPRELAGDAYDADIPIYGESELPGLIRDLGIDFVFFAYSDVSHEDVMHRASLVEAAGASFVLLGPGHSQLVSKRPVVSVTATRTGAGKSPLTQYLARSLTESGRRLAVIRHPMPYGDLLAQRLQRFASEADLAAGNCTIEEREEYEPYVAMGIPIYAGVDYRAILRDAEKDAELVLWDGGNNDFSFLRPDLDIVVVDALRAGHEVAYFPGEVNFRRADVLVIGKSASAPAGAVEGIRERAARLNPGAMVVLADLEIEVNEPGLIEGKRVLVVEDGPTVTHGGLPHGAGMVAARGHGATPVDPRPYAVGTIRDSFDAYPHLERVLPAMGYSEAQRESLAATIRACSEGEHVDCLVDASPARLQNVPGLDLDLPVARVSYRFVQLDGPPLAAMAEALLEPDL